MKNRYLYLLLALAISSTIFAADLSEAELKAKIATAYKNIFGNRNVITVQFVPMAGKISEAQEWINLLNEIREYINKRTKDYDHYWVVISEKSDELINALRINFQANIKPGMPEDKPHGTGNFDEIDLSKVNFTEMVKTDKTTGKFTGIIGELLDKAGFLEVTSNLLSEKSGMFESTKKREAREMTKYLADVVEETYGKAIDDFNAFAGYAAKRLKEAKAAAEAAKKAEAQFSAD